MSENFVESDLEEAVLEWLDELGYEVAYGANAAPEGDCPERETYADVFLPDRLQDALAQLNPDLPDTALAEAYRQIAIPQYPELLRNNHAFHKLLTEGVDVPVRQSDGSFHTEKVQIFDFEHPEFNDFLAVNQFTVIENGVEKRPDVVIFINGLPLVVIELKNVANEVVDVTDAYNQLQTYKDKIPSLFTYNAFLVASDGVNARAGTLTSDEERFMAWRTVDGRELAPTAMPQIEVLLRGMLAPATLMDLLRHFILFQSDGENTYKILAGYHQYHAVNKAVRSTIKAAGVSGDHRIGVVWHTQGSGKSLSMVFYAGKLILSDALANPTIVVITDRNDLDDQLFGTFQKSQELLRTEPDQAANRGDLRAKLNRRTSGGIIFTTIQKFAPEETGDTVPVLTERSNVIVMADEAHRSQYGFNADVVKADSQSAEIKYGYAKYMHDSLPNASYIGFTGTPIEETDRNTRAVFGNYIDVYDMTRAVEDGTTVRIYYESRIAKLELPDELKPKIDSDYEEITEYQEESQREQLKSKWARIEAIVGAGERVKLVAKDIVEHFEKRQQAQEFSGGKAMIVVMSRRIAVDLYCEIVALRPDWHNDDLMKGKIKVVMTGSSADPADWQPFVGTKKTRETLAARMKDTEDELQLVIVRDMWLTGFDVPSMHTMYVDKPMKGHNLMQAIARVNRVFQNKEGGLIVDYIGIADSLKKALAQYTESDRKNTGIDTDTAVQILLEKLDLIQELLHGCDYSKFFSGKSSEKMQAITQTMDFVLGLEEDSKKDYLQLVAELAKAYSLCSTTDAAKEVNVEVGFHKAVKASIVKLIAVDGRKKTTAQLDQELNQLISRSISSNEVVDILGAVGLNKPNIAILSDEFLEEVRGMKQKNLAVELLKRLLQGDIKGFRRHNLVQSKKFSEMLEASIHKYQNRAIETTQVIMELIELAKNVRAAENRGEKTGLSDDELAFYDALADNESAKEVMGDEILKQIARDLTESIRKNISVDWSIRKSVQAKMKMIIKRLLKKYGYPPDQTAAAVETVMEQTKLMCVSESGKYSYEEYGGEMLVAAEKGELQ
ncbi:MAG: type I restriction endonuclease subunit R [Selenomonas sp.]|jgi:type I restriction enzyme R subunit|nr:type I restriction endonuclease subunit R [Selenomonas sp.]